MTKTDEAAVLSSPNTFLARGTRSFVTLRALTFKMTATFEADGSTTSSGGAAKEAASKSTLLLSVVVEEVEGVVVGGGTAKLNEYATDRTAASVVKTTGRLLILMFGLVLMNYEYYDRER